MSQQIYSDLQLDALRELANIGSGNAATALSRLLGRPVDISVPTAIVLPLADAVDAAGPPETEVTAVVLPIHGDIDALVLLLFTPADAANICNLLGIDPDGELRPSALREVANILGSSYVGALATMTGLEFDPDPPQLAEDMLGAIVTTVLASSADGGDVAFLLDSDLSVEGTSCSLAFMLVPTAAGVAELLSRLGV